MRDRNASRARGLARAVNRFIGTPKLDPSTVEPCMSMTERMRRFADAVYSGMELSAAYDLAYRSEGMQRNAVWANAGSLLSHQAVTRRLQQLREAEEMGMSDEHDRRRSLVLSGLEEIAQDKAEPTPARVKALELLGKVRGTDLFSDRVETVKGDLTRDQVQAELAKVLARHMAKAQPQAQLALPSPSSIPAHPEAQPSPEGAELALATPPSGNPP